MGFSVMAKSELFLCTPALSMVTTPGMSWVQVKEHTVRRIRILSDEVLVIEVLLGKGRVATQSLFYNEEDTECAPPFTAPEQTNWSLRMSKKVQSL